VADTQTRRCTRRPALLAIIACAPRLLNQSRRPLISLKGPGQTHFRRVKPPVASLTPAGQHSDVTERGRYVIAYPNCRRLKQPAEFFFSPLKTAEQQPQGHVVGIAPPRVANAGTSISADTTRAGAARNLANWHGQQIAKKHEKTPESIQRLLGGSRSRAARGNHRPAAISSGVLASTRRCFVCCTRQHTTRHARWHLQDCSTVLRRPWATRD